MPSAKIIPPGYRIKMKIAENAGSFGSTISLCATTISLLLDQQHNHSHRHFLGHHLASVTKHIYIERERKRSYVTKVIEVQFKII